MPFRIMFDGNYLLGYTSPEQRRPSGTVLEHFLITIIELLDKFYGWISVPRNGPSFSVMSMWRGASRTFSVVKLCLIWW